MTAFIEINAAGRTDGLEYQWLGPEHGGTPLVFLHEGVGSIAAWRDFPAVLCAALGRRGLVYSRRGYGQSTALTAARTARYLHDEAWLVLPALLAALQVDRPILIGHSDGGSIALLYAARHATQAALVMAPHVFVEPITLEGIRAARAAWDAGKLTAGLSRLHADPAGAFLGWNDAWLLPEFAAWNIESEIGSVRCALTAVQGYDDQYGTMAQLDRIAAAVSGPCRLLKLDRCGHSPHRDAPAAVIDATRELLAAAE